jgi:hypothetical protein
MKVDSENIHLPEIRKFIGKRVEMIIIETLSTLPNEKKDGNKERFFEAAGKVEIDEDAVRQLREVNGMRNN